ncbi:MAG TPA: hypothetical protein VIS94_03190 [Desulfomonilia bacterium]
MVSEGKDQFVFKLSPESEQSNRLVITCGLYEYRFNSSDVPYHWEWVLIDVRSWKIRVLHESAPVWRGNCYLDDSIDVQLMNGYTEVTGSLKIGVNIESLKGLENLVSVGGDLGVLYNKNLKEFEGLEGLTSLGGNLDVWQNPALSSMAGLSGLTSIGGSAYISGNSALESLRGIGNITSIDGDLNVYDNVSLAGLGMTKLKRVGGSLWINYNPRLDVSLAKGLREQVAARDGIGYSVAINDNKDCTAP